MKLLALCALLIPGLAAAVVLEKKEGPSTGGGNNYGLAEFYLYGDLAMQAMKHRLDHWQIRRPDQSVRPAQPIIDTWNEIMAGKITIYGSLVPMKDSRGRRISVVNDPAQRASYVDWSYSDELRKNMEDFDLYLLSRDLQKVFRVILGHLAAQNPDYEDLDRGISSILADECAEYVAQALQQNTKNSFRIPLNVAPFRIDSGHEKAQALFMALNMAGAPLDRYENIYDRVVSADSLVCRKETAGAKTHYHCDALATGQRKTVNASGRAAENLFHVLASLQPLLQVVSTDGQEIITVDSIECTKNGNERFLNYHCDKIEQRRQ